MDEVVEFIVDLIGIFTDDTIAVGENVLVIVVFLAVDVAGDDDGRAGTDGLHNDVGAGFG